MPRVTLKEQKSYEFSHPLTVRVTDINYAGHLGNEALLGLIHEARASFMRALNFNTLLDKNRSVGLIIADLAVNFKAEVFAHEKIIIDSQIDELSKKSLRLFHRIRKGEQLVALVETGLVAYAYQERKVTVLPDEFLAGLRQFHNKNSA